MKHKTRRTTYATIFGAPAFALVLSTLVSSQPGAAAHLKVDGGVLQSWDLTRDQLPGIPTTPDSSEPLDLSLCGSVSEYAGIVNADLGVPLVAPPQPEGKQLGWILVGTHGNDTLTGGNHNDCLLGGGGDDTLVGHNGRDILVGGLGADSLDGGTGKDSYYAGDEGGDTCRVHGAPDGPLFGCDTVVAHTPGGDLGDTDTQPPSESEPDKGKQDGGNATEGEPATTEPDHQAPPEQPELQQPETEQPAPGQPNGDGSGDEESGTSDSPTPTPLEGPDVEATGSTRTDTSPALPE